MRKLPMLMLIAVVFVTTLIIATWLGDADPVKSASEIGFGMSVTAFLIS